MPPQNQNENQPVQPVTQPTPVAGSVVVGGEPSVPLPQSSASPTIRKSKKVPMLIAAVVFGVVLALGAAFMYMQNKNAKVFSAESKTILGDLSQAVNDLYEENISETGKTIASFDEAKQAQDRHMNDLRATQTAIGRLEDKYRALKPTGRNKAEAEKLDQAFVLAKEIAHMYEDSLDFRQETFKAFDQLPYELEDFVVAYAKGGLRTDFIDRCNLIVEMAKSARFKMEVMQVEDQDKPVHELRLQYLKSIEKTFAQLSESYRMSASPEAIAKVMREFSASNARISNSLDHELKRFVTDSMLADDLESFNNLVD